MSRPVPRETIRSLAPYVPGRPIEEVEAEYGIHGAVKLASNENPLGPSPLALEAARKAVEGVHLYPDGSGTFLRRALSARFGVPVDQIILGSGSSELIDLVTRAFADTGDEIVVPQGIFRMFAVAAGRAGASFVEVPVNADLTPDLDAMRRRISDGTKLVAIANPNNPTGAFVRRDDLTRFVGSLPESVLLVLDEAYFEYASGVVDGYPDGLELLAQGRTVLVTRTFSKISGLAGLRIGYGFGPADVVAAMNKVREPFNANLVAQAAALAALGDDAHRARSRDLVVKERDFLYRELSRRKGLRVHPSIGNFLLVEMPAGTEPLDTGFGRRGVIIRPMAGWGFPGSLRVSVGTHAENVKFLEVLDQLLAGARGQGLSGT
jgi:histidinol-phosphate aminotransferase